MNKKTGIFLFLLFFVSRLLFINTRAVFFDSGEYINLFSQSNYFQAIVSGHFPPHEGYIILFWPVFHLAKLLGLNPIFTVINFQILLAYFATYLFYKLLSHLADKRIAFIAAVISSLTPLFWITNVTIMMEISYVSFFFFSLYLLIKYLSNVNRAYFLHFSAFLFALTFLTHPIIILWLPLFFSIVFYEKREKLLVTLVIMATYLILLSVFNAFFISTYSSESAPEVIHRLYFVRKEAYIPINFTGLIIAMRNFFIPFMRNNTVLIPILGFLSLIIGFKKNRKLFIFGIFWIGPALIANQWWDSLLYGRHALIAGFGLAFLTAYLIKNRIILSTLLVCYILLTSIPALGLLRKDIPYLQEADFVKSLPINSILIESNFARPQVEKIYRGELFTVNTQGELSLEMLVKKIDNHLMKNRLVFISSAALSEPYGLYSGPYLHNLGLSYKKPFTMENTVRQYTLAKYKELDINSNLIIYKFISKIPSPYPNVKNMINSYRRIDYYDPLWRIYSLLTSFFPQHP